jgi:MFS family permease
MPLSPEAQGQTATKNEALFIAFGALVDLASRLASPQVVLPWIYSLIGGPLYLFGFLIPSVRVGSIASQLAAVAILEAMSVRKWLTAISSAALTGLLLLITFAVLELPVAAATALFFFCTLGFGACNGIVQLTAQDVMAKTVRHDRIGSLIATQSSLGGALTLLLVVILILVNPQPNSEKRHLIMVGAAALVWLLAALAVSLVEEPPKRYNKVTSLWHKLRQGLRLYKHNTWFRRYTIVRVLYLSVGLATPFYSIHAATLYKGASHSLTVFVLSVGVANMCSGLLWRPFLRKDPRLVLVATGTLAAAAGGLALCEGFFPRWPVPIVYAIVLALLALSVEGLTQSSKTYVALMAPGRERPLFLAANNTILGALAVGLSGALGAVAHMTHIFWALVALIVLALCASITALSLVSPSGSKTP